MFGFILCTKLVRDELVLTESATTRHVHPEKGLHKQVGGACDELTVKSPHHLQCNSLHKSKTKVL